MFFVEMIVSSSTGVSYPAINPIEIGSIPIALPPLPEQQAIAAHLDAETKKIDGLVEKERRIIEKMKEYRSALISAAVTGKIDVSTEQKETSVPSVPSVDRICPQKTRKAQKEEK